MAVVFLPFVLSTLTFHLQTYDSNIELISVVYSSW